jgi:hypothetical protein
VGEILITDRSHPYLVDHDVSGTPVVPVAMVLEWFTAAARMLSPGETVVISDLDVLSKISLERLSGNGELLRISTGTGGSLALYGTPMLPHYRANLGGNCGLPSPTWPGVGGSWGPRGSSDRSEGFPFGSRDRRGRSAGLVGGREAGAARRWAIPDDLDAFGDRPIYDGHLLFHGPAFQVVRSVDGVSVAGASGTLVGARDRGWPEEYLHTDPAAVDGLLQLATLWAERVLGRPALPMGVGEFRLHRPGVLDGAGTGIVRAGKVHGAHAECDIQLCTAGGEPVAELARVRLVARPDGWAQPSKG